jgi:hypothetical protein
VVGVMPGQPNPHFPPFITPRQVRRIVQALRAVEDASPPGTKLTAIPAAVGWALQEMGYFDRYATVVKIDGTNPEHPHLEVKPTAGAMERGEAPDPRRGAEGTAGGGGADGLV